MISVSEIFEKKYSRSLTGIDLKPSAYQFVASKTGMGDCRRYLVQKHLRFSGYTLSRTEEQAKAGTCARDRRALQQLAMNVHVKHSDLT